MKIKNGKYINYNNLWLEVLEIRDDEDHLALKWEGSEPLDATFEKSAHLPKTFYKKIIRNNHKVFEIRTKGYYNNCLVDVFQKSNPDQVEIGTSDLEHIKKLNLDQGFEGYFMKEVPLNQVYNLVETKKLLDK